MLASPFYFRPKFLLLLFVAGGFGWLAWQSMAKPPSRYTGRPQTLRSELSAPNTGSVNSNNLLNVDYEPRFEFDSSGFYLVGAMVPKWTGQESLEHIATIWDESIKGNKSQLESLFNDPKRNIAERVQAGMSLATLLNYEAEPYRAYALLADIRKLVERDSRMLAQWLATVVYLQGVTGLRCGENDNCVMCRGDGACILPIRGSAVHQNRHGSELAVRHFSEYLDLFPDDRGVRWLLNLAHMTLGEHPTQVNPHYLIELEHPKSGEPALGVFQDIAFDVGANRFNQAGGAIMDDFDNDGQLDIVTTAFDLQTPMSMRRNMGNGTFSERAEHAGGVNQLGGLYCVQADYNNDGFLDIFIPRGAWLLSPLRPTLLENQGDGTFRDVTADAGLLAPANSNSAAWADFDNDGVLDLFVCCERQPNRLYRGIGDGTFEDVAVGVGVAGNSQQYTKGAAWIDFNNDSRLDLFLNHYKGTGQLFENDGDGKFIDVTKAIGVQGPEAGFSCWSWDYDQDGFEDIFATSYEVSLPEVVAGLTRKPHTLKSGRLYRNIEGGRFEDRSKEAGLDGVYGTMGSNFGDLDNDGYPDIYLATGEPRLETLIPNRLFRNNSGRIFDDVTFDTRTGHLQKGHAVSIGDWKRNGANDIFVQTGGAGNGDRFHNVLFANPGTGNAWLNLHLVGTQSNRSAIGCRIAVHTSQLGTESQAERTFYKTVSTGSSFGANPLEQMIGLGAASAIERLEIAWLGSGRRQVFLNVPINAGIRIYEHRDSFEERDYSWKAR